MGVDDLFLELDRKSGRAPHADGDTISAISHSVSSPVERVTSMEFSNQRTTLKDVHPFVSDLLQQHMDAKTGKQGLLGIYFTPNSSFSNKLSHKPSGFVCFTDPDSPVSSLLMDDSMFRHTLVVPVITDKKEFIPGLVQTESAENCCTGAEQEERSLQKNAYYAKKEQQKKVGISPSHFTDRRFKLANSVIPQYSGNGPSLSNMELRTDSKGRLLPVETKAWVAELGENGSVGIHSRVVEQTPTAKKYKHYILVSTAVPAAARQFRKYVQECAPPMSYGQMVDSPQYKYLQSLSRRNACRLAKEYADALDLVIETRYDNAAYRADTSHGMVEIADPAVSQPSNYFLRLQDQQGRSVVQYMDANTHAPHVRNQLVVFQGHYHPTIGFNTTERSNDLHRCESGRTGIESCILAMPTSSGRNMSTSDLHEMPASMRLDMLDVSEKIHWDGCPSFNARMHPEAYHKINDSFVDTLQRMAAARKSGNLSMVPGRVGISTYTLERSRASTTGNRRRTIRKANKEKQKKKEERAAIPPTTAPTAPLEPQNAPTEVVGETRSGTQPKDRTTGGDRSQRTSLKSDDTQPRSEKLGLVKPPPQATQPRRVQFNQTT